jgi:hypothetical protein
VNRPPRAMREERKMRLVVVSVCSTPCVASFFAITFKAQKTAVCSI